MPGKVRKDMCLDPAPEPSHQRLGVHSADSAVGRQPQQALELCMLLLSGAKRISIFHLTSFEGLAWDMLLLVLKWPRPGNLRQS